MRFTIPLLFAILLLAGLGSCKKNPIDSHIDTTIHKCDTCNIDTAHHSTTNDSTSHNFVWTQSSVSGEAGLTGCWVFGPTNVYVLGGAIRKWDGASWKDVTPVAPNGAPLSGELSGFTMFAFSEADYWITHGGLIFHIQGSTTTKYQLMFGGMHSSWGTSSTNMYSVGDGGTILHFDGTSWTRMASGTTNTLSSIWGTSNSDIWACGLDQTHGSTVLLHFDGSAWSIDPLSGKGLDAIGGFDAVWACDSAGHHIAVTSGSLVAQRTDAGPWRNDSSSAPNKLGSGGYVGLYCLSGNSSNDYVASGGWGWVGHWNGRSWMKYDELFNYGNPDYLSNAISEKDNTICAVGEKNGAAWVAIGQRK